jgi:triosephosphate isomerase
MTANRKLIAGNWKMNGLKADGLDLASDLAGRLKGAGPVVFDMLVCPPFPLLFPVGEAIADSPLALGGQDCASKTSGAHTGDVAPTMLKDAGCRFVILGHSERRTDHGESDALVKAKAEAARQAGLVPIVCVGETEAERDGGRALEVVGRQVAGSLPDGLSAETLVIAYEPVWAIGTGKTPTVKDVAEVHGHIRGLIQGRVKDAGGVRLLYGGSVKPANARELLAVENVDGALVGGASLVATDFWEIARAAG